MGTSRDFTTGTPTGATAVLDRLEEREGSARESRAPLRSRVAAPTRRPRRGEEPAPAGQTSGKRNRLGSRQVVSVRGRRTAPIKGTSDIAKISVVAVALFSIGIAIAMWLSGVSTQQTFRIQGLVAQESQLSNQLETLNRDLANVSSTAELARRAGEMGMVVPDKPGILQVENSGDTVEQRAADPAVSPIIDVNGAPVRPGQASSDPNETDELTDNLEAVPTAENPRQGPGAAAPAAPAAPAVAVAPYSAGGAAAPANPAAQLPGGQAPAAPAVPGAPVDRAPAPAPPAPAEQAPAPEVEPTN